MCGIVGYVGPRESAAIVLAGLSVLDYRGYDSAGVVAVSGPGALAVHKARCRVRELRASLPAGFELAGGTGHQDGTQVHVGLGHTRWATHGAPTDENAHPLLSEDGRVAVVHNGILDNDAALRARLSAEGVAFASETDSEVLAHLVARAKGPDLEDKVLAALREVSGTYAVAVVDADHPDRLVVARNGSPVVVGIGDGEMFVASDASALVAHTRQVLHLDDGDVVTLTADGWQLHGAARSPAARQTVQLDWVDEDYALGAYEHFMLKEIREQPEAVRRVLRGRVDERSDTAHLGGLELDARQLREVRRVKVLGCGSSYYSGQLGAQLIEEVARIPADAEPASEFRYRSPVIDPHCLFIAVSQSGETYDTLGAVHEVRRRGGRVVGLVNVVGSSIARACDGGVYLHAGPESAVASTKALTNMSVCFGLLAVHLARIRDLSPAAGHRLLSGLQRLPEQIADVVADDGEVEAAARWLAGARSVLFVGRVRGYPVAREGAQKLKEITYLHAEAYQTSELKHGPLALVAPDLPTVAVVPDDELLDRNRTALREIAARSGPLVVVTHPGTGVDHLAEFTLTVPKNEPELDPVLLTVPLQLLAYHCAVALGRDVDKPRNLAKSVTVE